jgi:ribosomal protein L37AE/L43A
LAVSLEVQKTLLALLNILLLIWGVVVGDQNDCPNSKQHERKEALSIFKELWSTGNSTLRRMYSSWDELERNIEVKSDTANHTQKHKTHVCPYCGAKQAISKPLDGVFPYLNCESCKHAFFVQNNLFVRKLTEEEEREIPEAWIRIVDDLAKKKVAVVLRFE